MNTILNENCREYHNGSCGWVDAGFDGRRYNNNVLYDANIQKLGSP